jgi:hypothetical protein
MSIREGGDAHLKDRCGLVVEVLGRHAGDGGAEFRQGAKDSEAVFGVSFDENVEVFGASGLGVDAYGMTADYQIT